MIKWFIAHKYVQDLLPELRYETVVQSASFIPIHPAQLVQQAQCSRNTHTAPTWARVTCQSQQYKPHSCQGKVPLPALRTFSTRPCQGSAAPCPLPLFIVPADSALRANPLELQSWLHFDALAYFNILSCVFLTLTA